MSLLRPPIPGQTDIRWEGGATWPSSNGMGEEHVSSASLFDLRAEVLKRKREAEEARRLQPKGRSPRGSTVSPSNGPADSRAGRLPHPRQAEPRAKAVPSSDDAEALARSRAALEAKSHLYDRLQGDELAPAVPDGAAYLVDFDRKGWDSATQRIVAPPPDSPDAAEDPVGFLCRLWSVDAVQDADGGAEESVEYVDEFGRTRTIRASERARLDAEKEETISLLNGLFHEQGLEPKHYDPSWEVRDKGVGFFSFSRNTHDRQRQLRALQDLRQRTVEARARAAIAREERRLRSKERRARLDERRAQLSTSGGSSATFASLFLGP